MRQTSSDHIADIERGLRFTHIMTDLNQRQNKASVAMSQAMANLLLQKGLISEEELRAALAQATEQVQQARQPRVRLGDMGDKYAEDQTVEIDCDNRLHLCHARCCSFKFYLTKQDLDEGIARWDYGNPYWIKQASDGYCVHSDKQTRTCTIHPQRPHTCRQFDCRHDKRVWIDFENRIPAPMPTLSPNAPIATTDIAIREWVQHSEEEPASKQEPISSAGDQYVN